MQVYHFSEHNPRASYLTVVSDLLAAPVVHTGEWQTINTSGSDLHATHELEDVSLVWDQVPSHALDTIPGIDFNWAREHFEERVSGQPLNPAPSHVRWPYAINGNAQHTDAEAKFDHTYPERFWPRFAGTDHGPACTHELNDAGDFCGGNEGIRFHYGDLKDVVGLLATKPLTRQAYLPIWFPEDTGATEEQRVPCTLGYHFMQRRGFLSCRYYIRSCDVYRHMSNDVFFAAALMHWMCGQVAEMTSNKVRFRPGSLLMHISSLHAFKGDVPKIRARMDHIANDPMEDDENWGAAV